MVVKYNIEGIIYVSYIFKVQFEDVFDLFWSSYQIPSALAKH